MEGVDKEESMTDSAAQPQISSGLTKTRITDLCNSYSLACSSADQIFKRLAAF